MNLILNNQPLFHQLKQMQRHALIKIIKIE